MEKILEFSAALARISAGDLTQAACEKVGLSRSTFYAALEQSNDNRKAYDVAHKKGLAARRAARKNQRHVHLAPPPEGNENISSQAVQDAICDDVRHGAAVDVAGAKRVPMQVWRLTLARGAADDLNDHDSMERRLFLQTSRAQAEAISNAEMRTFEANPLGYLLHSPIRAENGRPGWSRSLSVQNDTLQPVKITTVWGTTSEPQRAIEGPQALPPLPDNWIPDPDEDD